jgi:CobQ-like glutamine amidotransferase family enzyme
VGELLAEPAPGRLFGPRPPPLTGFENHSGHTRLGPEAEPLATVRSGIGNGDGTEGAWRGTVFGTYLHGPALARNPAFADLLLARATGEVVVPLADTEEQALRIERLAAVDKGAVGKLRRLLVRRG